MDAVSVEIGWGVRVSVRWRIGCVPRGLCSRCLIWQTNAQGGPEPGRRRSTDQGYGAASPGSAAPIMRPMTRCQQRRRSVAKARFAVTQHTGTGRLIGAPDRANK